MTERRSLWSLAVPVNYTKCMLRHTELNGRYDWIVYYQWTTHPYGHPPKTRTLQLHGRYRWLDCLHSYAPPGIIMYYLHRSWIRNERTGGEVLVRQGVNEISYGHGSGRYEWGSMLVHR